MPIDDPGGIRGIWRELRQIGRRGRQVWRLVPWRHRSSLGGALLVMCLVERAATRPRPRLPGASWSIPWTPAGPRAGPGRGLPRGHVLLA